jgi:NAD(P)-dependent dehydrogenase (short-subunit alcohol dehydrogenase family)
MPRTVVITGTASGPGRAAVALFAAEGWNVVATVRTPEDLNAHRGSPSVRPLLLDPETLDLYALDGGGAETGESGRRTGDGGLHGRGGGRGGEGGGHRGGGARRTGGPHGAEGAHPAGGVHGSDGRARAAGSGRDGNAHGAGGHGGRNPRGGAGGARGGGARPGGGECAGGGDLTGRCAGRSGRELPEEVFAEQATAAFGAVDVLVNTAGSHPAGPMETASMARIQRHFQAGVFGPIALAQAFVPYFRARRSGVVVNLASVRAGQGSVHAASTAALAAFSEGLNAELAPYGVVVKVVLPGTHAPGMFGTAVPLDDLPGVTAAVVHRAATDGRVEPVRYYTGVEAISRAGALLGPEWYWEECRAAAIAADNATRTADTARRSPGRTSEGVGRSGGPADASGGSALGGAVGNAGGGLPGGAPHGRSGGAAPGRHGRPDGAPLGLPGESPYGRAGSPDPLALGGETVERGL